MTHRDKKNGIITRDHNAVSKLEHASLHHNIIKLCTEVAVTVSVMNGAKLSFVILGSQIGHSLQCGSLEEI